MSNRNPTINVDEALGTNPYLSKDNKSVTKGHGNMGTRKSVNSKVIKDALNIANKQQSIEEQIIASNKIENQRRTKQRTFDIFEDQELTMQELKLSYLKKTGKSTSLNKLVQDALDEYLPKIAKLLNS